MRQCKRSREASREALVPKYLAYAKEKRLSIKILMENIKSLEVRDSHADVTKIDELQIVQRIARISKTIQENHAQDQGVVTENGNNRNKSKKEDEAVKKIENNSNNFQSMPMEPKSKIQRITTIDPQETARILSQQ